MSNDKWKEIEEQIKWWKEQNELAKNILGEDENKQELKRKESIINKRNPNSFEKPLLPYKLASNKKKEADPYP